MNVLLSARCRHAVNAQNKRVCPKRGKGRNMEIEDFIIFFVFLGLFAETITDVLDRKIWMPLMIIELPLLLGLNYAAGRGSVSLWIGSIGIGLLFYLLSVVTGGQIGKGDALLFCMTGAGVGLWENFILIYLTFLLAFLAAMFLFVVKRVSRKKTIPLAPFLLLAYLIQVSVKAWG